MSRYRNYGEDVIARKERADRAAAQERQFQQRQALVERQLNQQLVFQQARQAHQQSQEDLNTRTAGEAANVFAGFADIMSRHKPGTAGFRDEMLSLKDKYPLGFAAEAVKGHLGPISQFHDQEFEANQKALAKKLFDTTGMSPAQFGQLTNVRATNAPLQDANKQTTSLEEAERQRADQGKTIAADLNGRMHLFNRDFFENLSSTFRQPAPEAAAAPSGQQASGIQPIIPTYGGEGAAPPGGLVRNPDGSITPIVPTYGGEGAAPPGGLVRNPDGSITPIVPTYGGEGAAPPGALVRTGVAQIGTPPPTGVPLDQQIVRPETSEMTPQTTGAAQPAPAMTNPAPNETMTPTTPVDHLAAVNWANANPNDPRAQKILDLNQQ